MSLFGKLFPETLFPRKLSADAEQRLRLAEARAEEALIRTHVQNALLFVDTLDGEVGFERAIDIYVREMGVPEPLASVVATRALVSLGDALVPPAPAPAAAHTRTPAYTPAYTAAHTPAYTQVHPTEPAPASDGGAVPLPRLRLNDAAETRRRRA